MGYFRPFWHIPVHELFCRFWGRQQKQKEGLKCMSPNLCRTRQGECIAFNNEFLSHECLNKSIPFPCVWEGGKNAKWKCVGHWVSKNEWYYITPKLLEREMISTQAIFWHISVSWWKMTLLHLESQQSSSLIQLWGESDLFYTRVPIFYVTDSKYQDAPQSWGTPPPFLFN